MRSACWTCLIAFALVHLGETCATAQNSVYHAAAKQQKAEVSILAISSSIHSGASGNEEIYLADILLKGNAHQMAKLVDVYPPYDVPIRRSVLADRRLLRMTLVPNPECDATGRSFFLAPGDTNVFDSKARSVLNDLASERIPCYNVVHEATRLAR